MSFNGPKIDSKAILVAPIQICIDWLVSPVMGQAVKSFLRALAFARALQCYFRNTADNVHC